MRIEHAIAAPTFPLYDFELDNLILRINVTIPADTHAIAPVVAGIVEIARWMECTAGREREIETVLRAALTNAVTHGCRGDRSKQVQCCVACDEHRSLVIVVRDPGLGFDPWTAPNPTRIEKLFSSKGRAIYLVNELTEEARSERARQLPLRTQ